MEFRIQILYYLVVYFTSLLALIFCIILNRFSIMPHIPWNDDLVNLLMHCVIVKGGHICGGKRVSQTWTAVNEMFFEQGELIALKPTHYKYGDFRKIRDKYKSTLAEVQKDIESGNQSGKEGELSPLYVKVKQICDDIAEKDAEKDADANLREKLNETEREVLASAGPLKRKLLNGEVIDNTTKQGGRNLETPSSSGSSGGSLSVTERLVEVLESRKKNRVDTCFAAEEQFEKGFLAWIKTQSKTVGDLMRCAELSERFHEDVIDIGLNTLVSMYCTRGANFSANLFKQELREMDLPMLACSKIYMALQCWRREYESVAMLPEGRRLNVDDDIQTLYSTDDDILIII